MEGQTLPVPKLDKLIKTGILENVKVTTQQQPLVNGLFSIYIQIYVQTKDNS